MAKPSSTEQSGAASRLDYRFYQNEIELQQLSGEQPIAFDTEFIRHATYYSKAALIQIHHPDSPHVYLCDPLCGSQRYWQLLQHHPSGISAHSSFQDLEIMYQITGALPQRLFDSQLSFALLQAKPAISYADLVAHYLGIELRKDTSRSDWLARPLSREQLHYAAADVWYLAQLLPRLQDDLDQRGRLSWAEEDNQRLLRDMPKLSQHGFAWHKLPEAKTLRGIEITIADFLCTIREQIAQHLDMPRKKVISDHGILLYARRRAQSPQDYCELLESPPFETYQDEFLEQLQQLKQQPSQQLPAPRRLDRQQRQRYERLLQRTQHIARELNIHPDRIISAKKLRDLILEARPDSILHQGWRANYYDDILNSAPTAPSNAPTKPAAQPSGDTRFGEAIPPSNAHPANHPINNPDNDHAARERIDPTAPLPCAPQTSP